MALLPGRTSARLALVFGLCAGAVALIAALMIRAVLPEHPRTQLSAQLAGALIAATPSRPEAVAALADRLGFEVVVLDGDRVLTSPGATLSPAFLRAEAAARPEAGSFETRDAGGAVFVLRDGARLAGLARFTTGLSAGARLRLGLGLGAIAAVLGLAFVAVQRLTRPLTPLARGLSRIGAGELATRLAVRGSGEIADLARAANDMAGALERAETAKREFLVAIGHEFSSPIARILFQAERIPDPDLRARISANLGRIDLLFRTLVSAETQRGTVWQGEALPFPDVLEEIAERFDDPRLRLDLPAARRLIHCDRMRLDLLVSNFLANALRHAPEGAVTLTARQDDDRLTISVCDHGPGLAPEVIARLGEPFLRADPARRFEPGGGMGLGLYLCQRIVAAAGGTMELRNRAGGGLRVQVNLPCVGRALPGPG